MSITPFGSQRYAFFRDIDNVLGSTIRNFTSHAGCDPTLVVAAAELILGSSFPSQEPDACNDDLGRERSDMAPKVYCGPSVTLFTWPSAILMSCFLVANPEVLGSI